MHFKLVAKVLSRMKLSKHLQPVSLDRLLGKLPHSTKLHKHLQPESMGMEGRLLGSVSKPLLKVAVRPPWRQVCDKRCSLQIYVKDLRARNLHMACSR